MIEGQGRKATVRRSSRRQPFTQRTRFRITAAAALAAALATSATQLAHAADGTWNGATDDGQWTTAGNWVNNVIPGGNGGAAGTNGDTATFLTSPPPPVVEPPIEWWHVAVDPNRNVKNLDFASTTLSFRLGASTPNTGNTLYLSDGGVAQNTGNSPEVNGDIYAPVQLNGAAYTFLNNNSSAAGLRLMSDVTARPGGGTVLTLDGTHGILSSTQAEINGALLDHPGGGALSVVKNGTGTWEVNGPGSRPSTYSGDTIINAGVLRASTAGGSDGLGGFSPNSHYIVKNGAALRNSNNGGTVRRITLEFGGQLLASQTVGSTINIASNAGPGLLMDFDEPTNQTLVRIRIPINLTGTVADEGGITLLGASGAGGTGLVEIGDPGSAFNMGTVRRPFDIAKGADANTDYDLRVRGPVSGSGGLVKKGTGTLRFDNLANPFTGQIEIEQGTFVLNENNSLSGAPGLLVNGGTMRLKSNQTQTFGPVALKKGTILGANDVTFVRAPSYAFDVAAGDTAVANVVLSDADTPAALVKDGAGAATIQVAPNYTGSTTVNNGTLAVAASLTASPAITVTGGTLQLSASNTDLQRVIKTGPLSITGDGRVDITQHKLITTTPAGAASGGVYEAGSVHRMVQTAYQEGAWSGPGLMTSKGDAQTGLTTVAIATGEQLGVSTFAGQSVAPNDTIAFYTYGGDTNFDGKLDADDYGTIDFSVLLPGVVDGYYNGDFNYDGVVNADDYGVIDFNILAQTTPFPTGGADAGIAGVTAVPEPTACGMLLAGAGMLACRRRRVTPGRISQ